MYPKKISALLIWILFCYVFQCTGQTITLSAPVSVPADTVCGDTAVLVYEFTLARTGTDTVKVISFTPTGTAVPAGILHYTLWSGSSFSSAVPVTSSVTDSFSYRLVPAVSGTNYWITAHPAGLPGTIAINMDTTGIVAVAGADPPMITGTASAGNSHTIAVRPAIVGVSAPDTVCVGNAILLTADSSSGVGMAVSYHWSGPGLYTNTTAGNTDTVTAYGIVAGGSYTVSVTYAGVGCISVPVVSPAVSVNDTPTLIISTPGQVLCNGAVTEPVTFSGTGFSPVYAWTHGAPSIGIAPSGTGSITPFAAINTTATPQTASFTVTASSGTCAGSPYTFSITVNPVPTVTATLSYPGVCNNDSVSLSLSTTADFTKFIFSSALPVGVLPGNLTLTDATGTTSFTASISGTDSIISSVYLTDSAYGCAGAPDSVILKVYPTPSVAFLHDGITLVNDTVCANSHNDDILFINHSQGNTSYSWTSGDTSVFEPILPGFYLSGNTGIFPGFQSYNNSSHRKTDSVTIVAEASGCRDTSYLSIVVDPVPHINDLTDSSVLYSNDTVMPSVTFFLHDSLGISTGFEWYNEDSSGNNIGKNRITTGVNIIPAMADSTNNTEPTTLPNTFVVTPLILIASTDSTCYGPPTNFTIKVKPIAALSSAHDTTVCDSVLFYYVPASATPDASFSWVRNAQSGISNAPGGSADDSTGDINEVLADTTNSPVLVKYFFTISSPEGGINHDTVKVTVSPRPKLNPVTPAAFCSNTPYNIALTSPTAGPVSYRWLLDTAGLSHIMKPGSGLLYADSAANSEISDTLLNTSYDTLHVSYAVMLTLTNGCANEQTAAITIHPTPALAPVAPPSFNTNAADSIKVTLLTEDAVYYHWQRQYATGITGTRTLAADSGAAPLITDHLTNTTDDSVEVAYTFTLTGTRYPGCTAILTDSLYIHPKPRIYLFDTTVCGDSLISYTVHSPTEGNVTYSWYRDTMLAGTLTVSGNNAAPDSIVHEYVANTTDSVVTAVYCFKVFANTDSSADTIYVKINPTPRLTFNPSPAFCNISQDSLVLTVPTTGIINTTWSRAITPGISNPYNYGAGSDTTRIFEMLNDTTNFIVPVNYTLALYATNGLLQCPSPLITVTDSIKPTPVINVVHPTNCNDSAVSFIVTSPTEGAHNYTWYLDTAATAGYLIPNPLHGYNASTTNTDSMVAGLSLINPNDTLVHAPYYFTVSANGCSNVVQVIDTVRPTPVFADSVAILREICSGLPVNITVGSPTEGTVTYNWALSTVPGITYTGITEGSGNAIHDTLNNVDSVKQLTVVYVFTLTADGCTNDTPKIVYNIDPIPHLNSIKAMRICGDSLFYYDATSSVTDITNGYSWKSPNTTAYDFLPNFGNGDTISGVRINKVFGANSPVDSVQVNVINFILSERGCVSDSASNSNNVYITVEPRPLQPIVSVYPAAASLCQGSEFLNFGDSLADPSVTYLWQCYLDGAPHPQFLYQLDSQNTQSVFAVMKFDTAGTYHIILKAYISPVTDTLATCYTTDTLTYTISAATDTNNDTARVIYQDNMLICLKNNQYDITHYQWGYDNTHLTPILIDTVINGDSTGNQQNYYAPNLDTANKHWWVETWQGDMGCIQKSYYNPPDYTAYFGRTVSPANTQNWPAVSMKVYPNPAQNIIKAALTDNTLTDLHFEIYDITGRKIMEQPANGSGNLTELPVTGLVPGCYFITCMQQGKRIGIARFIKN